MIVIAVLLFAAVAAVTVGVTAGAQGDVAFDIFNKAISASALEVFAAGAACGLAVAVGLWMALIGARHHTHQRREMRAIRRDRDREHAELAHEREALEAERKNLHSAAPTTQAESAGPARRFVAGLGKRGSATRTEQDEPVAAERSTR
jgi:hypothetical protein